MQAYFPSTAAHTFPILPLPSQSRISTGFGDVITYIDRCASDLSHPTLIKATKTASKFLCAWSKEYNDFKEEDKERAGRRWTAAEAANRASSVLARYDGSIEAWDKWQKAHKDSLAAPPPRRAGRRPAATTTTRTTPRPVLAPTTTTTRTTRSSGRNTTAPPHPTVTGPTNALPPPPTTTTTTLTRTTRSSRPNFPSQPSPTVAGPSTAPPTPPTITNTTTTPTPPSPAKPSSGRDNMTIDMNGTTPLNPTKRVRQPRRIFGSAATPAGKKRGRECEDEDDGGSKGKKVRR